jgi:type IV pilus assembly protein PilV
MNKHRGFTLVEVLIAMMILAVGLLGLAALQASGLKSNQSAYYRSQATQLAYDISDRMRVNVSVSDKYRSDIMKPEEAKQQLASCVPQKLPVTTPCTPEMMAEHDLFEWNEAIKSILPSATGTITSPTTPIDKTYTVTITWDENRDDNHDGDIDKNPRVSMNFKL